MRVFKNESIFNQETQGWEEFYSISGEQVDFDTFSEQAEIEELATEEDEIEQRRLDAIDEAYDMSDECESAREEFTEDQVNDIAMVEHYADLIEDIEYTCGCELRNTLYNLLQTAKAIGFEDSREEMLDFLD